MQLSFVSLCLAWMRKRNRKENSQQIHSRDFEENRITLLFYADVVGSALLDPNAAPLRSIWKCDKISYLFLPFFFANQLEFCRTVSRMTLTFSFLGSGLLKFNQQNSFLIQVSRRFVYPQHHLMTPLYFYLIKLTSQKFFNFSIFFLITRRPRCLYLFIKNKKLNHVRRPIKSGYTTLNSAIYAVNPIQISTDYFAFLLDGFKPMVARGCYSPLDDPGDQAMAV